jgi:uncharacterized membrane protein
MKPLIKSLMVVLVTAVVVHLAVILSAPNLLMAVAFKRLSAEGKMVNQMIYPPRTTEASRAIVRPSPDLAYSSCAYDLSKGPVRVKAARASDYMSVSVYAANSDNIFAINDRQAPDGVDLIIVGKGQAAPSGTAIVVQSPTQRGIVLERRLAPSAEAFAAADLARKEGVCTPV